jgi:4-amino-4-deoxy-L-arabinose transferase-like glycosyltransferase
MKHYGDKSEESGQTDYPHNNIISAFLYSGIFGGIVYLLFLAQVFIIYFRHRKDLLMLLPLFLIILFFGMVSGNSIFSIPVFAIFTILAIHYAFIVKNRTDSA